MVPVLESGGKLLGVGQFFNMTLCFFWKRRKIQDAWGGGNTTDMGNQALNHAIEHGASPAALLHAATFREKQKGNN